MSNTAKKEQKCDHSEGGLLLGALFGGLTSDFGQAVDFVADAAEVASEFHTDGRFQKSAAANNNRQPQQFKLGQQNSMKGMFSASHSGLNHEQMPDMQTRYMHEAKYAPKPRNPMGMAA